MRTPSLGFIPPHVCRLILRWMADHPKAIPPAGPLAFRLVVEALVPPTQLGILRWGQVDCKTFTIRIGADIYLPGTNTRHLLEQQWHRELDQYQVVGAIGRSAGSAREWAAKRWDHSQAVVFRECDPLQVQYCLRAAVSLAEEELGLDRVSLLAHVAAGIPWEDTGFPFFMRN